MRIGKQKERKRKMTKDLMIPDPAERTDALTETSSCDIACKALLGSGLLESISEIDIEHILKNLKYELIHFQKDDLLIDYQERMEGFLILYQGILKIPQGAGDIQLEPHFSQNNPVIGLEVCASEKKTSYFDVYGGSEGIAVKYPYQNLLDTKRIAPYSRIRLLQNMTQYVSEQTIQIFKKMDYMMLYDEESRVLRYLLLKEEECGGAPIDMGNVKKIPDYLDLSNADFSIYLLRMHSQGLLTIIGKTVRLHHPEAEDYLEQIDQLAFGECVYGI